MPVPYTTTLIRSSGITASEAVLLLAFSTGLTREQLITHDGPFDDAQIKTFNALCTRRADGEPIAYLTSQRSFYGRNFHIRPEVLIPRPETELLVDLTLQRIPDQAKNFRVVDLGTGSGIIAISLACERLDLNVTATDISVAALELARQNAQRLGAKVDFLESDWFSAFGTDAKQAFNLIVSNPPYIAAGDFHLEQGDLRYEPRNALTDGSDGLSAIRRIITKSPVYLRAGGWLLLEHGYDQAAAVRDLLIASGFSEVQSWIDLAGIERVSGGRLA